MNKWFAGCDNVKLCELHKKISNLDVSRSNFAFISISSCFFDLLPVESHQHDQEARALTIYSDNHLQIEACFDNLAERSNVNVYENV